MNATEQTPNALLAAHNSVRAKVGVPPLHWSDDLAFKARRWAERLIEEGAFRHDHSAGHGQNLYEITGGRATPAMVVEAWSAEAEDYDWATNTCAQVCGHYKQIVWRETRAVGCGAAWDCGRQVVVCDYVLPGNYVGERPY